MSLQRLRRKRKEENADMDTQKKMSDLEQLCGGDKETYEALIHTMFLDPRKISTPMVEAADNAKKFEKAKNLFRARIWYEIAGGLAIYAGDPKKVAEFFSASERVSGQHYPIAKNPEKAVVIAKEYYQKHLKALA